MIINIEDDHDYIFSGLTSDEQYIYFDTILVTLCHKKRRKTVTSTTIKPKS